MIKVKAQKAKESSVNIGLDSTTAKRLLTILKAMNLEDAFEAVTLSDEPCDDCETAEMISGIINGLEEELA
jgi:hypothetical protein